MTDTEILLQSGWDKELCQAKEKFGGLRFYTNGAPDAVHDVIKKYSALSYEICEEFGSKGEVRSGGWIRVLCDEHCEQPIHEQAR